MWGSILVLLGAKSPIAQSHGRLWYKLKATMAMQVRSNSWVGRNVGSANDLYLRLQQTHKVGKVGREIFREKVYKHEGSTSEGAHVVLLPGSTV